ncbi:hypothetical protein [Kozakia baliensis]|uniref:Uncharacterized protein n=1 Tax=Kozakia baliensis TaxID=153496 RepID=A0A1D8UY55_9PROT|nr:hypothetical protein [Kozakia baliensis]AOX18585.1 hypothetical protein A0U89_14960 [Kozakia baliensis]AOX21464.1 hypothetical protein A0U90_13225 [Kozakia baliensis]GBR33976.1 hypothetical protein AA0488_2804 [Kozakia baliensis NRIC 0488]GEL65825.1 hypothetical protein KBA01_31110 [Kozakia baliensis]
MTILIDTLIAQARLTAHRGDGCSYELFVARFTQEIDRHAARLAPHEAAALMAKADEQGDDIDPEEQAALFTGCCAHGIDFGCCPAGCDDADDADDESDPEWLEAQNALIAEWEAEEERARLEQIAARDDRVLDIVDSIRSTGRLVA